MLQPHLLGKRGYSSTVLINNPAPTSSAPVDASDRVTRADVASMIQNGQRSVQDAEMRAKMYADEWHNAAMWQMDTSGSPYTVYFNTWWPLSFPLEVIRGSHCVSRGPSATPRPGWAFRPPMELQGVYRMSFYITIQHQAAAGVSTTKAGLLLDGQIALELDQMDDDVSGDGAGTQRDVWLKNSVLINLDGTKEMALGIYARNGAGGYDTYSNTSSVSIGGWVCVERVACYAKGTESDGKINDPLSGKFIAPV